MLARKCLLTVMIATCGCRSITALRPETSLRLCPGRPMASFAMSEAGDLVVASLDDGRCATWKLGPDCRPTFIKLHSARVRLAASRDATRVISSDCYYRDEGRPPGPTSIMLWDATTQRTRSVLAEKVSQVIDVAMAPDGMRMAAVGFFGADGEDGGPSIRIWDGDGRLIREISRVVSRDGSERRSEDMGDHLYFSADGGRLLLVGGTLMVVVVDTRRGELVDAQICPNGHDFLFGSISPDGRRLLTVDDSYAAILWRLDDAGWPTTELAKQCHVWAGFTPDGQYAVCQEATDAYVQASRTLRMPEHGPLAHLCVYKVDSGTIAFAPTPLEDFGEMIIGRRYAVLHERRIVVLSPVTWRAMGSLSASVQPPWPLNMPFFGKIAMPVLSKDETRVATFSGKDCIAVETLRPSSLIPTPKASSRPDARGILSQ